MTNNSLQTFFYSTIVAVFPFILLIWQSPILLITTLVCNVYINILFYHYLFGNKLLKGINFYRILYAVLILFNIYTWVFIFASQTF